MQDKNILYSQIYKYKFQIFQAGGGKIKIITIGGDFDYLPCKMQPKNKSIQGLWIDDFRKKENPGSDERSPWDGEMGSLKGMIGMDDIKLMINWSIRIKVFITTINALALLVAEDSGVVAFTIFLETVCFLTYTSSFFLFWARGEDFGIPFQGFIDGVGSLIFKL